MSLIFAVITVTCISYYANKSHLHEFKFYSNTFSSEKIFCRHIVRVCKHTAQLYSAKSVPTRLVCYSVAISTKFDTYFTTFLSKPEYKKKYQTLEKILNSHMMLGFLQRHEIFFTDTSNLLTLPFSKSRYVTLILIRAPNRQLITTIFQQFSVK